MASHITKDLEISSDEFASLGSFFKKGMGSFFKKGMFVFARYRPFIFQTGGKVK